LKTIIALVITCFELVNVMSILKAEDSKEINSKDAPMNQDVLHIDNFVDFENWHHEGVGKIDRAPHGGMRLHCLGSKQGYEGCMAFFKPTLPDQIEVEYDVIIHTHDGLLINYIAMRGLNGEDLITDRNKLEPRTGVMKNYFGRRWGLQSYHLSICRYNDKGIHTNTANWRRNPGGVMVGHGPDPITETGRTYGIRLTKDKGHCELFVDGKLAHAIIDRDESHPIPDTGKFGFRLVGADVQADITNFRIVKHDPKSPPKVWKDLEPLNAPAKEETE
jgi:hypothetical protein